ncbi:MAG: ThiF family adenylyltransferase [Bacteroidetes bacterium]|nr:ThiF family adenylyltransferase [Bacteroidota bacterium]
MFRKTKSVDLGKFSLIGFGAIGNGVVWALSQSSFIKGVITVVEPENLETTNLQRYVLAEERHIGKPKIEIAQEFLKSNTATLVPVQGNWAHYLNGEEIGQTKWP